MEVCGYFYFFFRMIERFFFLKGICYREKFSFRVYLKGIFLVFKVVLKLLIMIERNFNVEV